MTTTRRNVLIAAPAVLAIGALPAAAGAGPSQYAAAANALWEQYCELSAETRALDVEFERARAALPAWARPGPEFMNHDGDLVGDEIGWPEMANPTPARFQGARRRVRHSLYTLKQEFEFSCMHRAPGDRPRQRAIFREMVRAFVARCREQDAERERVGVTAITARQEQISDQLDTISDQLREMPETPNAVAAAILIVATGEAHRDNPLFDDNGDIGPTALRFLQPQLSGRIAEDVRAVLDDPDQPAGELAWW
ncbi:MAG: hypothetical protein HC829_02490 [Bacteroidales bacterium]|nr:hypothetical protein [Bacteroidales bacterium]